MSADEDCPLCDDGIIVTVEYSWIGNPPERSGVPCWRCLTARADKAERERDQFRSQAALFQSGVVEAEQERDALRDQLNEAKLQNVLHLDRIDALLAGYPTSSDGDRRSPHHNSAGELLSARDPWKGAP